MRTATAGARVLLGRRVFDLVASNQMGKGDVLTVAQLAGAWAGRSSRHAAGTQQAGGWVVGWALKSKAVAGHIQQAWLLWALLSGLEGAAGA